ncbi:hypothetical protein KEM54_006300 [Ascosphaera aggregata]|nr:hypothetical protein KEM54_006300 [Ascosphaera aggregata]
MSKTIPSAEANPTSSLQCDEKTAPSGNDDLSPSSLEDGRCRIEDTTNSSSSSSSSSSSPPPPTLKEINAIYRKLDCRIIPPFWFLYFISSGIRSNIGLAQTMNMSTAHDLGSYLHLTPKQISTSLTLFYVCYVIFDLPSNLIMTRLSPRVWMSRIVVSVGVIGACFAAVKAAWSLYLLRLLLGIVIAGMWPGMSYYLTLFYPPSRTGKRIGQYYTAAQLSAAVVSLVSAGFQKMDGRGGGGLTGFQWMFLLWGLVGILLGISLLWWLPERPVPPSDEQHPSSHTYLKWLPRSPPALTGHDALIHYHDLRRVYHPRRWNHRDLLRVVLDPRLWPLVVMYFGVVGVGIGVQSYATVIINSIKPSLSGIDLSLLTAPIWIMDLFSILIITPISDRFHHLRPFFFSFSVCVIILGLLLTTYAGSPHHSEWPRYAGLLVVGFGLGPTVPITMTWTNEIFQPRHGEVGVAAAAAVVSGLGNLGSILTTYALYQGWASDRDAPGRKKFRKSNLVMVGILCASIVAAGVMEVILRVWGGGSHGNKGEESDEDDAGKREKEQRGFKGLLKW